MTILELRDVNVAFDGKEVLKDFSLSVERRDFVSITGPNGSGKTTLLRVILGLIKPDAGRVVRYDADGRPTKRLAVGYLPQKSNIDSHFPITVAETVRQGLLTAPHTVPPRIGVSWHPASAERQPTANRGQLASCQRSASALFDAAVDECGIREILDRPIGVLSGGQLQRTLLARAIVSRPELLVLDEPLSYVDKSFEQKIYDLMADLSRRTTIILVSHELTAFLPLTTLRLTL